PTLTFNTMPRHVSTMVNVRVASDKSPWLSAVNVGDVFSVAVSHGEGKFLANDDMLKELEQNGQIATQYVDFSGNATMESPFNPNGSKMAIEGITSLDGRILGKMGHSERIGKDLYKNYDGNFDMKIFESGVKYFK
ncbi:MAG: phosphoribosylformylglycinamidine synthase subunit PurQ, partial [Christensenellales bacterium]